MSKDNWLNKIVGRTIWSVRRRVRNDKLEHRVELVFAGADDLTLLISSKGAIFATLHPTVLPIFDENWTDTNFEEAQGTPVDNEEIKELFHKLWSAAGTTYYNKKEWLRLAQVLSDSGYKI